MLTYNIIGFMMSPIHENYVDTIKTMEFKCLIIFTNSSSFFSLTFLLYSNNYFMTMIFSKTYNKRSFV